MPTSTLTKIVRIERVRASEAALVVNFDDGRSISLPLAWYPRLEQATAKERNTCRLIGGGEGVHWPLLDEDLSAEGLLAGRPSMESQRSFQRWLKVHKTKHAD